MTRPDPNLVLVLKYQCGHDFGGWHGRITAVVCYSNDGAITVRGHEPGAILSPTWISADDRYRAYADLTVTGNLSEQFDGWLSWNIDYREAFSVGLERATIMTRTLRRIGKAIDTASHVRGAPADFATYLARFAEVIGCHRYAEYHSALQADGTHWRHMDVDDMRHWTADAERAFRTTCAGAPTSVTSHGENA